MRRNGQSILEYSMIIAIVAAALLAMNQYVYRAINARMEQVRLELDESSR